ncbi:MAG: hypothetical protein ABL921_26255 [Pirellula sp.]
MRLPLATKEPSNSTLEPNEQEQLREDAERETHRANVMRLSAETQRIENDLPIQSMLLVLTGSADNTARFWDMDSSRKKACWP